MIEAETHIWQGILNGKHSYPRRWRIFKFFLEDVGRRPSPKHRLRRLDVREPYSVANCCWLTDNDWRTAHAVQRVGGYPLLSLLRHWICDDRFIKRAANSIWARMKRKRKSFSEVLLWHMSYRPEFYCWRSPVDVDQKVTFTLDQLGSLLAPEQNPSGPTCLKPSQLCKTGDHL